MRYSLSYCIFGFPNATNVATSPCITSFACEPLANPLEDGILSPQGSTQYGYCSVDNNVATHQIINRCSSCISASGETQYLANCKCACPCKLVAPLTPIQDLTALDAGCAQKPTPGHILGLNGSVFSPTAISIVDPALITPTATPNSGSSGLPSSIIAAIIVVVIVVLLIVAAFVFIRIKKRQNRRKRASYETKFNAWGGSSSQMPQSPLSFQCQTHIGPASPNFFPDGDDNEAHSSYPASGGLGRKPSLWKPHNAVSSFQNISAVTESPPQDKQQQPRKSTITSHQNPLQYHPANHPVPLHSLNTAALPSYPTPTHASPMSGSQSRFSPDSYTPTSAVSTRSNAPLLPYVPAQHASTPSLRGPHNITSSQTASTPTNNNNNNGSPLLRGVASFTRDTARDSTASTLPPAPPPKSPRMMIGVAVEGVEGVVRFKAVGRRKERESGSPVESRKVPSVFPPPPPPRR
ncbi:hypothetical protein CONLIGDRAFT_631571 [Coniochaeta ligniaria NRRL 30616]|uniref:Uncharacterized protein n=1 Tax=Coniochaeta ligniaria NRRL 30616 TaxID=1408157 RepID=A0A1J7JJP7_9PEZI|nr:hypothetical protein CONLIGDRAFT_631571 [Coniochaeta ligniaria NRRL 30616]